MEKIRLGRTNMMVSRLGFGGIPIQRDSEDEAVAIVKKGVPSTFPSEKGWPGTSNGFRKEG